MVEADLDHLAEPDAAEFHGSAGGEAADGLVEEEQAAVVGDEDGLFRGVLIGEESVNRAIDGRGAGGSALGHPERGAPGDHRLEGGGGELETVCPGGDVDAAGVPKAGAVPDQAGVFFLDEDVETDLAILKVQDPAFDPADPEAAVVDGRAGREGAGVVGLEGEAEAGNVGAGDGGLLEAVEVVGKNGLLAGFELDVSAGDQGAEAGDGGGGDARADDPETAVAAEEVLGCGVDADGGDHRAEVAGEFDAFDDADADGEAADFGLAGLDAVGGLEADEGERAFVGVVFPDQGAGHDEGDDGYHPDAAPAPAVADDGPRFVMEMFAHG